VAFLFAEVNVCPAPSVAHYTGYTKQYTADCINGSSCQVGETVEFF